MKRTITYSLLNGQKYSNQYYETISDFSDEVLVEMHQHLTNAVTGFIRYLIDTQIEAPRNVDEYFLELLVLGVLWRVYVPGVVEIDPRPFKTISFLTGIRKNNRLLKPAVDWLRGILGALFLLPDAHHSTAALNVQTLSKLLDWLAATGDFPDEVKRLRNWQDFLSHKTTEEVMLVLNQILALAEWFDCRSLEVLGTFTPNVEHFLANSHHLHHWLEDRYLTGRQRVEYHMTMVSTEILNRTMENRFLDCNRHVVILPPCMCAPKESCQAQLQAFGYACAHCSPHCRVHQITMLGQKHGFDVLVMPDELEVFSSSGDKKSSADKILNQSIGVVGVSCPLTNPGGHWHMRELDVPVQGVLLDYCGCEWHWGLEEHFPTDTNIKELMKILGN